MTNEVGAIAPAGGQFRPESLSHFKEVAKNMALLLDRPVQKCQEDLARIYGYSGLHELQQVLKLDGIPGPFEPRYNYLGTANEEKVVRHERRMFTILFGKYEGFWRENHLAEDKCFLVFEIGIFQEAAEHRACFQKILGILNYEVDIDQWPLIYGLPLGLRSWLASGYTETVELSQGWQEVLPSPRFAPIQYADIRWQRRQAGLARLETMFEILAPRVGGRKPNGLGKVDFKLIDDEGGGIIQPEWESFYLIRWLNGLSLLDMEEQAHLRNEAVEAFAQRPSKATAIQCSMVKDMKDPVAFRDRWAFESFKAALQRYPNTQKALFSSTQDHEAIQSLYLAMDIESAAISESMGQLWRLSCTWSEVTESTGVGGSTTLQPVIHANGSLIVPFDDDLIAMHPDSWFLSHDASSFANGAAADAFETLYLPSIGVKSLDFLIKDDPYSIIEIDEILLAPSVKTENLKAYFDRLLQNFDDSGPGHLPDSYGFWCKTLSLVYEDEEEFEERAMSGENADYVYTPAVLLINIQGCGLISVKAVHENGKPISSLKRDPSKKQTANGVALANMVIEAVQDLDVDVVIYDCGWD